MNKNSNARLAIKWVRDRAKSAYVKAPSCAICDSTEALELHHFNGMTALFERWAKAKKYSIVTDEEVLAVRDEFIAAHHSEIYEQVVTLCKAHHAQLHKVYGLKPLLGTASKQAQWVTKLKEKHGAKSVDIGEA